MGRAVVVLSRQIGDRPRDLERSIIRPCAEAKPVPKSRLRRVVLPICHLALKAKKPVYREKLPDFLLTRGVVNTGNSRS